ncbi:hypothetical protein BN2475_190005 [Paraburkholderia ribeironis]|uniref:Uncharacterized protein n=1 Tax=Paraburkholderia ribeironis TaxID=1247936 RepID=A0A1N7RV81_9BURK|nr:hypothetical protein BN2475_190005 [Paraburkholderia ribeironis]
MTPVRSSGGDTDVATVERIDSLWLSPGCPSCASYYLSYLSCAELDKLFTMAATALVSIRRRVCSH